MLVFSRENRKRNIAGNTDGRKERSSNDDDSALYRAEMVAFSSHGDGACNEPAPFLPDLLCAGSGRETCF